MALDREQVGLLFKVRADASEAQRTLQQFRGTVNGAVTDLRGRFDNLANSVSGFSQGLSGGLSGLAGSLTGVAGLAAGAAAGLGALALQTANYAGSIADLAGKTNLATDTIQSLRLAATLSGQSFESVSETAVIFQRRMEEARSGNDKLKATFDALRINLDGPVDAAFRQTLERLSTVEDGSQKTAAAVDLFGRSGANLLPVMSQLDGSFDNLVERAKELGIVLDEEAIKKADEFGDQVDILKLQLGGLANDIGTLVIPAISSFTQGLSGTITIFRLVSNAAEDTATKIQRMLFILKSFSNITTIPQGISAILGAPGVLDKAPTAAKEEQPKVNLPRFSGGGGGKANEPKLPNLPVKDFSNIVDQYFAQLGRLEEEQFRRMEQARERSARVMEQILQEQQDREIDAIQAQIDQRVITEEEGAARIAAVRVAAFARIEDELVRRIGELDEEVTRAQTEAAARPFDTILQRRAEALRAERELVRRQITQTQEERTSAEERGNEAIRRARAADTQNLYQEIENKKKIYQSLLIAFSNRLVLQGFDQNTADAIVEQQRVLGRQLTLWEQIRLEAQLTASVLQQEIPTIGATFINMKNAVAESLGALVAAFVAGRASLREAAAGLYKAALAPLKDFLLKKARAEFALGLADLAMFNFAGAAKHFLAGGALAAAAGLIDAGGSAIAGGSQTVGPSSLGGAGGSSQSNQTRVIEQGGPRRGQEPQIVIIRAEVGEGVIVRQIERDYKANGPTRQMLRRDILGEGG